MQADYDLQFDLSKYVILLECSFWGDIFAHCDNFINNCVKYSKYFVSFLFNNFKENSLSMIPNIFSEHSLMNFLKILVFQGTLDKKLCCNRIIELNLNNLHDYNYSFLVNTNIFLEYNFYWNNYKYIHWHKKILIKHQALYFILKISPDN